MEVLGPWIEAYFLNQTDLFYKQYPEPPPAPLIPANLTAAFPSLLPEETEDCLFLDVYVPRRVLENKNTSKVAVMVWVHGGGLILGSKTTDGSFKGLLARSMEDGGDPVILVAINYRVRTSPSEQI
jgi:carboxylesterase type B